MLGCVVVWMDPDSRRNTVSRIKLCSDSTGLLTLADEVIRSTETSEPIHPTTQCHVTEYRNRR